MTFRISVPRQIHATLITGLCAFAASVSTASGAWACTLTPAANAFATTGESGADAAGLDCDVDAPNATIEKPFTLDSVGGAGATGATHAPENDFGLNGGVGGAGGALTLSFGSTVDLTGAQSDLFRLTTTGGIGGAGGTGRSETYGSNGGTGGTGGAINITTDGALSIEGETSTALTAISTGGVGGKGYGGTAKDNFSAHKGSGGTGGLGGDVTIISSASIGEAGSLFIGIDATSTGGLGGAPGDISDDRNGGNGGNGGDAGTVTITNSGDIQNIVTTAIQATSQGGRASDGHNESGTYHYGGFGGSGGNGGAVVISNSGALNVAGYYGINATSVGGLAGAGGIGHVGGQGGNGGSGGAVTVNNYGNITIAGLNAAAISAWSQANAGYSGGRGHPGSNGGAGGDGGSVAVTNSAVLSVSGQNSVGINVASVGGDGGKGGFGMGTSQSGDGGDAGHAGDVIVNNHGAITTQGDFGHGILAKSVGGSGGSGGTGGHLGGDGGHGGDTGGAKGQIEITNDAHIETNGFGADGIVAISNPGIGGFGGTKGGIGGRGGNAGEISVTQTGTLRTNGDYASGIYGASIGGMGADGGNTIGGSSATGGDGGSAGTGGDVTVTADGTTLPGNDFNIETYGNLSAGVHLQSIGGNGGRGGNASASGFFSSVAVGGNGGKGGNAGDLTTTLTNGARVLTNGGLSDGLLLQSIGGGGGLGGTATASAVFSATAVGGSGGDGGNGGSITVSMSDSSIATSGPNAAGVLSQSIGGGGGSGGQAMAAAGGTPFAATTAIGGAAGGGGAGGVVTIINDANNAIYTGSENLADTGANSAGILAQSIGGGGGNGGSAASLTISAGVEGASFSNSETIGGSGGEGGSAGTVSVTNQGLVETYGVNATGILMQSLGGGGGNGGDAKSASFTAAEDVSFSHSRTIGGSGGNAGHGGAVTLAGAGKITTYGDNAAGAVLQSIGGGGGNGGSATSLSASVSGGIGVNASKTVGGSGLGGGNGGTVTIDASRPASENATISTSGENAIGLMVQSIGGGGGNGANATSVALTEGADNSVALSATIGGSGGKGGDGGTITMLTTDSGDPYLDLHTTGNNAIGLLAQSIGGGGGNGGDAFDLSGAISEKGAAYGLKKTIGGSGAGGGNAGALTMENHGAITTTGNNAIGVLLQAIGGGGGNGGAATSVAVSTEKGMINSTRVIGGTGGGGGDGGIAATSNYFRNYGSVATTGARAAGIIVQSIGGNGGNGGDAFTFSLTLPNSGGDDDDDDDDDTGGDDDDDDDTGDDDDSGTGDDDDDDNGTGDDDSGKGSKVTGALQGQVLEALGLSGTTTLGGEGGTGGDGMTSLAINEATVITSGLNAHGVVAQSIGGGGGSAGSTTAYILDLSKSKRATSLAKFAIDRAPGSVRSVVHDSLHGASVGSSGSGGYASAYSQGAGTATTGDLSIALLAQAIGGGGGDSGFIESAGDQSAEADVIGAWGDLTSSYKFTAGLGSTGTVPLLGAEPLIPGGRVRGVAKVYVENGTQVSTQGVAAHGAVAQAIGNGGGSHSIGLFSAYLTGAQSSFEATLNLGSEAFSSAGHGAESILSFGDDTSLLSTSGDLATGALVQSIGGGGGLASTVVDAGISLATQTLSYRLGALYHLAEHENYGGPATATLTGGQVQTAGTLSFGVFAQSVGGGGGAVFSQLGDATGTATTDLTLQLGINDGQSDTGGAATITNSARIVTKGEGAHGLVAQSVGGGGGSLSITNLDGAAVDTAKVSFGTDTTALGAGGGTGSLTNSNSITTSGDLAIGLLAQSVGGAGGMVSLDGGNSVELHGYVSDQSGGEVNVTTNSGSSITTTGTAAIGILAQSTASGGLLTLLGDTSVNDQTDMQASDYDKTKDSGAGGLVKVNAQGTIQTSGALAHGIAAVSTAGATVLIYAKNGLQTIGNYGLANSGQVSVTQDGSIAVTGAGAAGIYAFANNWNTVDSAYVSVNGTISASGNDGAAIRVHNTARNLISGSGGEGAAQTSHVVIAADARVLAQDVTTQTFAIDTADDHGRTALEISGTVAVVNPDGSAALTYDTIQRAIRTSGYADVEVKSGGQVIGTIEALEADRLSVTNFGTIDGAVQNAKLYQILGSASHFLEIDPLAGTGASIEANELRLKIDSLHPYLSRFGNFANDVLIVDSGTYLDAPFALSVADTPVLTFGKMIQKDEHQIVLTGVTASFANAGLTGNAATIAAKVDPLVQGWIAGEAVEDQDLYDFLLTSANQPTLTALASQIGQHLDASQHYGLSVTQHANSVSHLENLHSCGTEEGSFAAIRESECTWVKVTHKYTDDLLTGRSSTMTGLALGRQVALGENWRFGLGANINTNKFGNDRLSSDGRSYHLGAVVKYTNGPWLATAALSGSYQRDTSERIVPGGAIARSTQRASGVSARLRAGYEFDLGAGYLMPLVDFDTSWIHDRGYQETGGGAFDLAVAKDNRVLFDLHPRLRLGTELRSRDGILLRPFVEAGVRFALNDEELEQRFVNAALSGDALKMTLNRKDSPATLGLGFQAFVGNGIEAKFRYDGSFGKDSRGHAVSLKIGMSF